MHSRNRRPAFLVAATFACVLQADAAPAKDDGPRFPTSELRHHVEYLASDDLEGRETGSEGCRVAEEYIAQQFADYGLQPLGPGGDYFLTYTLYDTGYDVAEATLFAGLRELEGDLGYDLRPFPFSATGEATADVVFAGYGITAPEFDYDDYDGLDVQDKFVLVFRYEPRGEDRFEGEVHTTHATFLTKARNAQEHGARGMLLFTGPLDASADESLRLRRGLSLEPPQQNDQGPVEILAVQIHQDWGGHLAKTTELRTVELQNAVEDGRQPADLPLKDARFHLKLARRYEGQAVPVRNVGGLLPGSDPALRDEWIVVGAHHDHVGQRTWGRDRVFNGADDNASGTAAVLAMARSFTQGSRPKRSIAFLTFSGEEKGLLGSRAVVEQNLIPLDNVAFMLNLDMVGRNADRPLEVLADGSAYGLTDLVRRINDKVGLQLDYSGRSIPRNSDHYSFYTHHIPVLFLSTGTHGDYHRVGDHADKLDYDRMVRATRLAHGVAAHLSVAEPEDLPRFAHIIDWLGTDLEVIPTTEGRQVQIREAPRSSRGYEAGLRAGDIVLSIDGNLLDDPDGVSARLEEAEVGANVMLSLRRGGETLDIDVFKASPGYLGIMQQRIQEDDRQELDLGRNEGVLVREVLPGGPASDAGLRSGDILLRMAGTPVGFGTLIPRLAQLGAGTHVEVTVLREGRTLERTVVLGERPAG